jgi:hypothetical protein
MADQKISDRTALSGTGLISTPVARASSTTDYRRVDNLTATSNPTANDDSGDGYTIGSYWFRSDTGELWVCRDATSTSADWQRVYGSDYIVGNWYFPKGSYIVGAGGAVTLDTIYWFALCDVEGRITISDLGTRVGTGAASQNAQFAVYANNPATNRPTGNALSSTPNVSVASGATFVSGALSASVTLEGNSGIAAWLATNCSSSTPTFHAAPATNPWFGQFVGSTSTANLFTSSSATITGLSTAQTFGTWPDVTLASFTNVTSAIVPLLAFKIAANP